MRLSKRQSQKSKRFGIWLGLNPLKSRHARESSPSCGKNGNICRRSRHVWLDKGRISRYRENLDKLWDIGASDAIEQMQTTVLHWQSWGHCLLHRPALRLEGVYQKDRHDIRWEEEAPRREERKWDEEHCGLSRSTISSSFGCSEAGSSMEQFIYCGSFGRRVG